MTCGTCVDHRPVLPFLYHHLTTKLESSTGPQNQNSFILRNSQPAFLLFPSSISIQDTPQQLSAINMPPCHVTRSLRHSRHCPTPLLFLGYLLSAAPHFTHISDLIAPLTTPRIRLLFPSVSTGSRVHLAQSSLCRCFRDDRTKRPSRQNRRRHSISISFSSTYYGCWELLHLSEIDEIRYEIE